MNNKFSDEKSEAKRLSDEIRKNISPRYIPEDFEWGIGPDYFPLRNVMAVGSILAPEFVEVEGCVYLLENVRPMAKEVLVKRSMEKGRDAERELNSLSIRCLFGVDQYDEQNLKSVILITDTVAFCWKKYLGKIFPSKSFVVQKIDDGQGVTFWQASVG